MSATEYPLVCQLHQADVPAMLAHLLRLDETDRVQRFAQPASDAVIHNYVRRLDFERDAYYGVWSGGEDSRLISVTHLAMDPKLRFAEIGVSVDGEHRRRGIAGRMLGRAILHARNSGVEEVVMYFLPYNTELIELARTLGMKLSVGDGQGMARLTAMAPDAFSVADEMLASWAEASERSLRGWSNETLAASNALRRTLVDAAQGGTGN